MTEVLTAKFLLTNTLKRISIVVLVSKLIEYLNYESTTIQNKPEKLRWRLVVMVTKFGTDSCIVVKVTAT